MKVLAKALQPLRMRCFDCPLTTRYSTVLKVHQDQTDHDGLQFLFG